MCPLSTILLHQGGALVHLCHPRVEQLCCHPCQVDHFHSSYESWGWAWPCRPYTGTWHFVLLNLRFKQKIDQPWLWLLYTIYWGKVKKFQNLIELYKEMMHKSARLHAKFCFRKSIIIIISELIMLSIQCCQAQLQLQLELRLALISKSPTRPADGRPE